MLAPEVPAIQHCSNRAQPVGWSESNKTMLSNPWHAPGCDSQRDPIVTKKTRTEISLEIQEEIAIRTQRISTADCPECRGEVRMVPANEAALIARVTAREIHQRVNAGELHFIEDAFGLLYVCAESLRNLRTSDSGEMGSIATTIE